MNISKIKNIFSQEPYFALFIFASVLGQVIIGNEVLKNDWGFLAYPIFSIGLGFLYWFVPNKVIGESQFDGFGKKARAFAFIGSLVTITIWFVLLIKQSKSLSISNNPFSEILIKTLGPLGIFQNLALSLIPLLILLICFRNELKSLIFVSKKSALTISIISSIYLLLAVVLGKGFENISDAVWENFLEAGLPEEILFRYLLLGGLLSLNKFSHVNSILISSLLFGLWHLPINIESMGPITGVIFCIVGNGFGGFLFGYLYYKTRSVISLVVIHTAINALVNP